MLLSHSTSITTREEIQVLCINNAFAKAEISLFGGHILSFTPKHDGRERLWVSTQSSFGGKKAIRGGIPVCWPWFGEHRTNKALASHGYVRTQMWDVINCEDSSSGTTITLKPRTTEGEGFVASSKLFLAVNIGPELNMQLRTTNTGNTPITYNCALHSYFRVSSIQDSELLGLSGQYKDKTRKNKMFDTPQSYVFSEETDRIHLQQPRALSIVDKHSKTDVLSSGHDSIVVWNPWREKSINMGDMADDGYLTMLCVETAITHNQTVAPQETHILEQIIK